MSEELNETADQPTSSAQTLPYDSNAVQNIPFTVSKGGKDYDVSIDLNPLSDEQYFKLQTDIQENARRVKTVSVELFAPKADLGRLQAAARHGYAQKSDWKGATKDADYVSALNSYLHVLAVDESFKTDDLLDDDAETPIFLTSNFSGNECRTAIYFKEATADQTNEFFNALTGEPQKGVLASAKKRTKEERIFALFEQLKTREENYVGRVPAWHAIEAVTTFFNNEALRMGKP